ncbi:MAG TPA: MFS transporter [Acetobacteraceae bacterium]|jgi:FSR family fosmidomycin resistance protein-like MFS transporter|nr:MFS transporter [Acetobacteraceae bacterium]
MNDASAASPDLAGPPPISIAPAPPTPEQTIFRVLLAISFCHLLNDMMQSLVPAIYPILKTSYSLSFAQIGLITLGFQLTASLLQPMVGMAADRRPLPYSLAVGMGFTLLGLLLLAHAGGFATILVAAAFVGLGSSVFHPESSRVARMASGGRFGLAQSVFQVGGNTGSALGPLLAAFIVLPHGQGSIAWFSAAALLAIAVLFGVGRWYAGRTRAGARRRGVQIAGPALSRRRIGGAVAVLIVLIFSKYFYLASINNYFTFYLIAKFHLSVRAAQVHLFVFMGAVAIGTLVGGPIGDRIGRKYVIWGSILGVLPFTLMLPWASLFWTGVLSVVIGLVLASAFAAILVYATELMPGRLGMVAGLFFGFAFGMGGLGAAALGVLADATSIGFVYRVCAFLPALGLLTALLPDIEGPRSRRR